MNKAISFALLLLVNTPVMAHSAEGMSIGFISGLLHPIMGFDHVVAMLAVGLWGAVLQRPAFWLLPLVFPSMMAFGAIFAIKGLVLPGVELGIALSGVILGMLVLFGIKAPLVLAALIVGAFAIFHGYAHGIELPGSAEPVAYGVGFVLATGLLHVVGMGLGLLLHIPYGKNVVRALGAAISLVGSYFLLGLA